MAAFLLRNIFVLFGICRLESYVTLSVFSLFLLQSGVCWVLLNIYPLEQSLRELARVFGAISSNKDNIMIFITMLQNLRFQFDHEELVMPVSSAKCRFSYCRPSYCRPSLLTVLSGATILMFTLFVCISRRQQCKSLNATIGWSNGRLGSISTISETF